MNLGRAIKDQRKIMGYSQAELAEACEITQPYLSLIEKNKKEPNLSTLKDLSSKLNLPVPILFIRAMDISDVPENKKESFKVISDSLREIVDSLYLKNDPNSKSSG